MRLIQYIIGLALVVATLAGAIAASGTDFSDVCYTSTHTSDGDITNDLRIVNSCAANSYIEWPELNLTILGNVTDGDVYIGLNWMFVDSSLRPDLDVPATLVFSGHSFAVEPEVLRDGVLCSSCNLTYRGGRIEVDVPGFSNYSLQGRQDFTVYSDQEPELDTKVYQTVDLGNAYRSTDFACVVQVFGQNEQLEWVLVQTNPERAVQGKILGNPDMNQPESLGYFPTENGVANTYFRNHRINGYNDFELVVQCTSNSTKLVYEESISTRYIPAGRAVVSRGVWLTDGDNAFYVVIIVIGGIILLWVGGMVWKSVKP